MSKINIKKSEIIIKIKEAASFYKKLKGNKYVSKDDRNRMIQIIKSIRSNFDAETKKIATDLLLIITIDNGKYNNNDLIMINGSFSKILNLVDEGSDSELDNDQDVSDSESDKSDDGSESDKSDDGSESDNDPNDELNLRELNNDLLHDNAKKIIEELESLSENPESDKIISFKKKIIYYNDNEIKYIYDADNMFWFNSRDISNALEHSKLGKAIRDNTSAKYLKKYSDIEAKKNPNINNKKSSRVHTEPKITTNIKNSIYVNELGLKQLVQKCKKNKKIAIELQNLIFDIVKSAVEFYYEDDPILDEFSSESKSSKLSTVDNDIILEEIKIRKTIIENEDKEKQRKHDIKMKNKDLEDNKETRHHEKIILKLKIELAKINNG